MCILLLLVICNGNTDIHSFGLDTVQSFYILTDFLFSGIANCWKRDVELTTIIDCLFLLLVLFGFTCGDILFCTQRLVFLVDRTSYHAMSLSTLELAFAVKSAFSVCSFTFACFKVCLFCNIYQYFSSFYNWIFYFTKIPHFVYQSVDGQFGLFISFGYCEQCCYDIHVQVFYFFFKYFGYMYSRTATTLGHIVYFINYVSSQSADSWVSYIFMSVVLSDPQNTIRSLT